MWWIIACVGLSTAGLLVLAVLALRVYAEVAELARRVEAGSRALAEAGERLRRAADRAAERTGGISRR